jgi:hypothetical protein
MFGSPSFLGEEQMLILDGSSSNNVWHERLLIGTAPPGSVEARLVLQFIQPSNESGSVHIDGVSFSVTDPVILAGDYNDDGVVDAADYVVWRKYQGTTHMLPNDDGLGTPVGFAHFDLWRSNFGATAGGNAIGELGVPELGALPLSISGLLGMMAFHARAVCDHHLSSQAQNAAKPTGSRDNQRNVDRN